MADRAGASARPLRTSVVTELRDRVAHGDSSHGAKRDNVFGLVLKDQPAAGHPEWFAHRAAVLAKDAVNAARVGRRLVLGLVLQLSLTIS